MVNLREIRTIYNCEESVSEQESVSSPLFEWINWQRRSRYNTKAALVHSDVWKTRLVHWSRQQRFLLQFMLATCWPAGSAAEACDAELDDDSREGCCLSGSLLQEADSYNFPFTLSGCRYLDCNPEVCDLDSAPCPQTMIPDFLDSL
jgi:hypothetical protein